MKKLLILLILVISSNLFALTTVKYDVPDMTCDHCAKTITKHLVKLRGFKKEQIKFNIDKKQVDISFIDDKPLSADDLKSVLHEAGYTLKKVK